MNELKKQQDNYNAQITYKVMENSKLDDEINKLKHSLKEKENMIKFGEKEIENLKLQNKDSEAVLNSEIKTLKEIYEEKINEEISKIKKQLIKTIGDNLRQKKIKYNESLQDREKMFENKFNELNQTILNSKLLLKEIQHVEPPLFDKNNIKNIDNNIDNNINNKNDNKNNFKINNEFEDNNANKFQHIFTNDNNNNKNILTNNNNQNIENSANSNEINNSYLDINQMNLNEENTVKNYTNKVIEGIDLNKNTKDYNNQIKPEKENEENIHDNTDVIIKKTIYNNNKNNEMLIDEGYLFDCTNSMYLSVYIYQGTEETNFEIYLRNIGTKTWAQDSKLLVDPSSKCKTYDVILAPQKPDEERSYKIIVKDLKNYIAGDYKIVFNFWSGGRIYGEKIVAIIRIKEKDNKKNEIDENIDKINEFRETFNLSEDEYSNEKILGLLKENNFNFEDAFSALFN